MRIILKNATTISVNPVSESDHIKVDIKGVSVEELLTNIDIDNIIQYYGVTELLDSIGIDQIKVYLENL